jgi:hypothetical protein
MEKGKISQWLGVIGFIVGILSVVIIVIAGLGTRFHWFDFRIGLAILPVSVIVGVAALCISLVAIILILISKSNHGLVPGIIGLVV